jgi:hypothetical protein
MSVLVPVLSVRQPWAWLIVHGWKNVENRTRFTHKRGRFLVHAGKSMTRGDYEACRILTEGISAIELPPFGDLPRGGIVGEAVLLDCVTVHSSEWFCGPYGYVLDEQRPCEFRPCNGSLNWFYAEDVRCIGNAE